jgi:hypothetical protein
MFTLQLSAALPRTGEHPRSYGCPHRLRPATVPHEIRLHVLVLASRISILLLTLAPHTCEVRRPLCKGCGQAKLEAKNLCKIARSKQTNG